MSYWCDDAALGRDQQRRDTAQERARRALCPVERRRGGWFVVDEVRGWSGPWKTEEAAKLARSGDYDGAHRLEREVR